MEDKLTLVDVIAVAVEADAGPEVATDALDGTGDEGVAVVDATAAAAAVDATAAAVASLLILASAAKAAMAALLEEDSGDLLLDCSDAAAVCAVPLDAEIDLPLDGSAKLKETELTKLLALDVE